VDVVIGSGCWHIVGAPRAPDRGYTRAIEPPDPAAARPVPFREALKVWTYVALNSFGGPAGQIAVMHRVLVETRHWVSERRFLHALNYCMLLPGPEAQQLAVYIGWLMHGVRGGLVAGILFVLPGFLAILALSILYAGYQDVTLVEAVFFGLKPAVLAIVAAAVQRVARRALTDRALVAIAAISFVALFFLAVPFPVVIMGAGIVGFLGARFAPGRFGAPGHGPAHAGPASTDGPRPVLGDHDESGLRPSARRAAGVLALGLTLWLAPVVLLVGLFGTADVYASQALFFSGAAVVTFGGAYAVLTYVAQQAVQVYGWLTPGEMLDGLALAETTPGPLIMVVEFVGFLGAYRLHGGLDPMLAGTLAAVLVTWVTFVPSFLWIFLGAPYAEYLRGDRRLGGALSAITAAVVGAILNLAVWFGLHAVFGVVEERTVGPIHLSVPDLATLDVAALAIAVGAFIAVFRLRAPMLGVLAVSGAVGALIYVATGR
jgi:chromate transporter